MRLLFLASAAVVLGLAYFLPAATEGVSSEFEIWRNLALVTVGVGLAVEAYLVSRKVRHTQDTIRLGAAELLQVQALHAELAAKMTQEMSEKAVEAEHQHQALSASLNQARTDLQQMELGRQSSIQSLQKEIALLQNKLAAMKPEDEVITLLALLQQKGRFVDFIMDDIAAYSDAQIGAAARVVHQGCAAVVREYFDIHPVHSGAEGSVLKLGQDYDAHRYRLLGKIADAAPFSGRLLHHGWLTSSVKLPEALPDTKMGSAYGIIAPAEVELSH